MHIQRGFSSSWALSQDRGVLPNFRVFLSSPKSVKKSTGMRHRFFISPHHKTRPDTTLQSVLKDLRGQEGEKRETSFTMNDQNSGPKVVTMLLQRSKGNSK